MKLQDAKANVLFRFDVDEINFIFINPETQNCNVWYFHKNNQLYVQNYSSIGDWINEEEEFLLDDMQNERLSEKDDWLEADDVIVNSVQEVEFVYNTMRFRF